MKNKLIVLILAAIFILSSCKSSNSPSSVDNIRVGTESIAINFMPDNPPAEIHVANGADNIPFSVVIDMRNNGAYPQPEDVIGGLGPFGKVYLSGYDPNILTFYVQDQNSLSSGDLSRMPLEGKSTINPAGGEDIITFTGTVNSRNLNVNVYEPVLLATACFHYETQAGPSLCIDPIPYSDPNTKKVCNAYDIQLSSQGAPIAVTAIKEEAFAQKTQFKITVKNVGTGDAILDDAINKCNPPGNTETGKIERTDMDKVKLDEVVISNTALECSAFAQEPSKGTSGLIRLINGEGYIICELPKEKYGNTQSAYTTPIKIKLSYGYRINSQRSLKIIKEGGTSTA